jgi:Tfp pilus assembly protein PilV
LSLVEVVVAMAIVTIALLPLMSMLPMQSMSQARAERLTTTTILAQSKLEEVRSAFNADFSAPLASGGICPGGQAAGDFASQGYPRYRYTVRVTDVRPNMLRAIRVSAWHDADGDRQVDPGEREVKLVTQVARRRGW